MKRLETSGLFGAKLIRIDAPVLVERYNRCLEKIGAGPTRLAQFDIDGMGWSPQIAQEKQDQWYLCHGDTQSIVILTPDQANKPIYRPFHSFDAEVMAKIFRNAGKQIADITTRTGMWLDVDKEITQAQEPSDLLMVDSVTIHPHTVSGVMKAAREQRELVKEFVASETVWSDESFRRRILESVKAHGDLRMRSIVINDISFNELRSYHTAAFGGVFVLRDLKGDGYMLVFEVPAQLERGGQARWHYVLGDDQIIARLRKEELIVVDLDWYAGHLEALDELKEYLLVETLVREAVEGVDLIDLTSAQMGRLAVQYKDTLPFAYSEIERLRCALSGAKKRKPQVPAVLWPYLMRPSDDLPKATQDVLWHLIARTVPCDVRRLYKWDKHFFFRTYEGWSEAKQDWAVECLTNGVSKKTE